MNDPILGDQISYDAEVQSDGSFQTEFPLSFSQDIMMGLGEESISAVFVYSGDTIYVTLSAAQILKNRDDLGIRLSGRSGRITKDMLVFNKMLDEYPMRDQWEIADKHIEKDSAMQYLAYRTNAFERDRAIFDSIRKTGTLSAEGIRFLSLHMKYHYYDDLMRYTWLHQYYNDNVPGSHVPDEYLAFIKQSVLHNNEALMTSNYSFSFLKGYELYGSKHRDNYHSAKSMVRKWYNKGWNILTPEQQGWMTRALSGDVFTIRTNSKSLSSADADNLAALVKKDPAVWDKSNVKLLLDAYEESNIDIKHGEPKPDAYLQTLKKEYGAGIAFDILLAQSLQKAINQHIERDKTYAAKAVKEIRNKPIRDRIQKDYDAAIAFLNNPQLPDGSNVHNLSTNAGDSILAFLAAKFPGKALYLDFWATWCGPCLEEMPSSKQLRKSLKDSNVVFVFLCSSSPESTWKQVISNMNLEGEHIFLTGKQTEYLYNKFGISAIPHYVVINKNGEIAFKAAARPSSQQIKEQLAKALK
ncbi:TlpA disulfide reductase family protein [Parasegetibacter sp. NRK P23]|uniref:TlpA family protein disulfide reductase n=1 Tax=Parasegetibacter sp. NRK P23 TaxID=2942999 RepID=UPI0020443972|nr:TlpA disulfide reductase family protein [Parasegetibacter sp. NRK P23]MCM5527013.1 TlpA family protein disulfide reductase [Parasegetibacter sp. NRK P23]